MDFMPRIFVTAARLADEAMGLLSQHNCICEFGNEGDSSEEIARKLRAFQPDGLIVRKGVISAEVIEASEKLKAISKHGVGVDRIDLAAATKLGIPVMITALANFESVAEHALALILALSRRIPSQDRKVRQGMWDQQDFGGDDLRGKTLGLIGFGRIGRRLAELVQPLHMPVLFFDPYVASGESATRVTNLSDLLRAADIVSIHCPLTQETQGLMGRQQIASLKPGAWIVNTARGAIIDDAALIEALREKRISAALDTFGKEPPDRDNPLLSLDNVVVSAHIGGHSRNSFVNMSVGAVENVLMVLEGKVPARACLVNPEVYEKAGTSPLSRV